MKHSSRSLHIGLALVVFAALALTLATMVSPTYAAQIDETGLSLVVDPTAYPDTYARIVASVPEGPFDISVWMGGPAWNGGIIPQQISPTGTELYGMSCDRVGCLFLWRGQGPASYYWDMSTSFNLGVWDVATLTSGKDVYTATLEIKEAPAFTTTVEVRNALVDQGRWLRFMADSTVKVTVQRTGYSYAWYHPAGSREWFDTSGWLSFKVEGAQSTQSVQLDDLAMYWEPDTIGVWHPVTVTRTFLPLTQN